MKKFRLSIYSILITLIILTIVYAILGIAPFGNKTIACADANIQYLDFFSYLMDVFKGNKVFNYYPLVFWGSTWQRIIRKRRIDQCIL